jgi:hypothetical protein
MQSTITINKLLSYNLAHLCILSQEQEVNDQKTLKRLILILQNLDSNSVYELIYLKAQLLKEVPDPSSSNLFMELVLLKINKRLKQLKY